jgi:hypothetical protein
MVIYNKKPGRHNAPMKMSLETYDITYFEVRAAMYGEGYTSVQLLGGDFSSYCSNLQHNKNSDECQLIANLNP